MKKIIILSIFLTITLSINAQSLLTDVAKADEMYKNGQFAQALFIYNNIDNDDSKISKKIDEIKEKLTDVTVSNEQFQSCILTGNNALKSKEYELAYVCFNAALLIKPDANFPKTKLRDISQYIQDPNIEKRFTQIVNTADTYFDNHEYDLAYKTYKEALVVKPSDKHCSTRLVEIDDLKLKKNAVQKEYDDNIYYADGFFKNSDLDQAKTYYQKALELLPNEDYPKQKLNEILAIQTDAAQLAESYLKAVENGNKLFNEQLYDSAQTYFSEALTYKPNEDYPKTMLRKINDVLSQINAKENEIAEIRNNISENISAGQYNTAKTHIQKGLSLLPDDSVFIAQKQTVDSVLAQRQIDETNFENFVTMAKESYVKKDYESASRYYSKALEIKPDDEISAKMRKSDSLNNIAIAKQAAKDVKNTPSITPDQEESEVAAVAKSDANNTKTNESPEVNPPSPPENTEKKSNRELEMEVQEKAKQAENQAIHEEIQTRISNAEQENAYKKSFSDAMTMYNKKMYDKALTGFKSSLEIFPDDNKSKDLIDSITNIFNNNIVIELATNPVTISAGGKQSFTFTRLYPKDRKNCYLKITIQSIDATEPKVFVNFYKLNEKKSGFVLKDVDANNDKEAIYIRLSDMPAWMREDISRIDFLSEGAGVIIEEVAIISIP